MKIGKVVLILLPIILSFSSAHAAGECGRFKGFIAAQIAEGTWTYKTSPISDQEWPEKKCQIEVATKLDDTVTLGTYKANGYLGCQAVYQVTETSSGRSYVIKSTPFAVVVSDSGKPLEALFAEVPTDDVRSAMKHEYRPAPFTIKLHNEGVNKLGSDRNCYAEFKPFPSVAIQPPPKQAGTENQKPAPTTPPTTGKAQALPQATWKPSFDCSKASTFSEKAICSEPLLGKLDGALSENYKSMLASNIGEGARTDLKATQRKWLSAERNKCTDNQCLVNAYRKRMDEVCDYPVISGAHPICTNSDEIK